MSSYRYLGYGITNENGVAQLKYDENGDELEHSYTGVGAGEIDVVASLDNPIIEGSIVSVPCNVLDGTFYDDGVTNPKTATWRKNGGRLEVDVQSDGTVLSLGDVDKDYYIPRVNNADINLDIESDWCIECDVMRTDTPSQIAIWVFSKAFDLDVLIIDITTYHHFKFTMIDKQLKVYIDGVYQSSLDKTITEKNCSFEVSPNSSLKYKNYVVYPI